MLISRSRCLPGCGVHGGGKMSTIKLKYLGSDPDRPEKKEIRHHISEVSKILTTFHHISEVSKLLTT